MEVRNLKTATTFKLCISRSRPKKEENLATLESDVVGELVLSRHLRLVRVLDVFLDDVEAFGDGRAWFGPNKVYQN